MRAGRWMWVLAVWGICCGGLRAERARESWNQGWTLGVGDVVGAEAVGFGADGWTNVRVPHDWSIGQLMDEAAPVAGNGGYIPTGVVWYRKTFDAPAEWRGRRVELEFEGVYMDSEVWINGVSVGRYPNGYLPIRVDLTPHLKLGEANVVAVRVDNSDQPNARWYTGTGIYRPVWLNLTAPVHVVADGLYAATRRLESGRAVVRVEATVANTETVDVVAKVILELCGPTGLSVASAELGAEVAAGASTTVGADLVVANPLLWGPEHPVLHTAKARVQVAGVEVDAVAATMGLRTVRVSAARGFELNGEPIKLLGGNVHADNGVLGAVALARADERKAELMKAAGYNAVRTSHNPASTAFLAACDRLGLLVLDEIYDGWEKAKTKRDYGHFIKTQWPHDIDTWVRRDRNHASVVMWSTGNEMYERAGDSGRRIAAELTERIRAVDSAAPRPVTAGVNGLGATGDWTKLDGLFAVFDVAGYNYELARQAADHERLPERVIFASESYQNEAFANWVAMRDHAYVIGDFVWSVLDYLGESGIGRVFPAGEPARKHWEGSMWPWRGAYCGDIDLIGWRKPISHYRQIVWDRGEMLYAAVKVPPPGGEPWNLTPWSVEPMLPSWTWGGREGEGLTVEVYSRYPAVRLMLNGEVVGEAPTTEAEAFLARFNVPYAAGELVAEGLRDGEVVEMMTLRTAQPATALRLAVDRTTLNADGDDLAYVTIEAVDAAGTWNPTCGRCVTVEVTGAGSLAGIGSGNPATLESYAATSHALFEGRALAVVRATDLAGAITVRVTGAGLDAAEVRLRSVAAK